MSIVKTRDPLHERRIPEEHSGLVELQFLVVDA
jgi:hypothetical protein